MTRRQGWGQLLLVCALASGCALSTPALHGTATVAVASDCISTMVLVPSAGFEEQNPVLGPEPDTADIFGACLVGLTAVHLTAVALPAGPWRRGWLTAVTAIELTFFLHNVSLVR